MNWVDVLHDTWARDHLLSYLRTRHVDENLLFWIKLEEYMTTYRHVNQMVRDRLRREITKDFIISPIEFCNTKSQPKHEVNISAEMKRTWLRLTNSSEEFEIIRFMKIMQIEALNLIVPHVDNGQFVIPRIIYARWHALQCIMAPFRYCQSIAYFLCINNTTSPVLPSLHSGVPLHVQRVNASIPVYSSARVAPDSNRHDNIRISVTAPTPTRSGSMSATTTTTTTTTAVRTTVSASNFMTRSASISGLPSNGSLPLTLAAALKANKKAESLRSLTNSKPLPMVSVPIPRRTSEVSSLRPARFVHANGKLCMDNNDISRSNNNESTAVPSVLKFHYAKDDNADEQSEHMSELIDVDSDAESRTTPPPRMFIDDGGMDY